MKNHTSSILAKLGARDRTRAVLKAIELGYLPREIFEPRSVGALPAEEGPPPQHPGKQAVPIR